MIFDKNFTRAALLIGGTGLTITLGRCALNSLFCDQYVSNIWQLYRHGFPLPLNKNLKSLSEDVLIDFNLIDKKDKFDFFYCNGGDRFNAGCYQLRKVYIGMPFYFQYRKPKHINKDELTFCGDQAPNWASEDGKIFLENLVLSNNAKKYAIAESIYFGKSYEDLLRCFSPLISSILGIMSILKIDYLLKDNKKINKSTRFKISFAASLIFIAAYYFIFKTFGDSLSKVTIDKFLEEIKDQDYIDGGLEYYYKKQKRNLAFRSFLGENADVEFKSNGDYNRKFSKRYAISEMIEKLADRYEFTKSKSK